MKNKNNKKIDGKDIELMMNTAFLRRNHHDYLEQYLALLLAFLFWTLSDKIMNDHKADIFHHLYLSPKNFNNTYIKSGLELCVALRTLERYRKKFVLSFQLILAFIQKHEFLKTES